ncbi:hypothetical protein BDA99DRAFT_560338 [Phascolomyces articulosus]|uniref:F-box domain-containing protein n=1 Tax=Phascolomyces articulosus TaxID=60185 RepID=A0AAD5PD34_9FUNG|nr:hypothetical protein BDA99DRAFT_560338 [Phascolomyces articulosus]
MDPKNDSEQCQRHKWNGNRLTLLLPEVIHHIASYLDAKDLKECMCTSINFNMTFRPFQYRSTVIKKRNCFTHFINVLEKYTDTETTSQENQEQQGPTTIKRQKTNNIPRFTHVGEHVRSLELQDGLMLPEAMKKLAKLCPNVTSLLFKWYNFPDHRMGPTTDTTYLFRSPVPFFSYFHPSTLTSLTLKGHRNTSGIIHSPRRPDVMIFPVLRFAPQLESLKLLVHALIMTIDDLEELHRLCPKLQHFEWLPKTRLEGVGLAPGTIITPTHTMKKLVLPHHSVWYDIDIRTSPWWTYVCTKYPSVKTLVLYSPVQQKILIKSQLSNPLLSQGKQKLLRSMELKRDYFPQLEEIHLGPFAGRPATSWPLLVKGIPNVTLIGDTTLGFSDWIHHPSTDSIQRLSLLLIPKAFTQLSQCALLTHLELGFYESTYIVYQKLPVDDLLSACPLLYKLTATSCLICYGDDNEDNDTHHNQENTSITMISPDSDGGIDKNATRSTTAPSPPSSSSLNTLIIRNSVIKNDNILARIGDRCPQLSHLDLSSCIWFTPNLLTHLTTRIHMPNRYFSYLRISDPNMFDCMISEEHASYNRFGWYGRPSHEHEQPRYQVRTIFGKDVFYKVKRTEETQHERRGIERCDDNDNDDDVLTKKKTVTLIHIERDQQATRTIYCRKERKNGKSYVRREKVSEQIRWNLAFYCHRVDQLYFSDLRLRVDDMNFCKKAIII